MKTSENRRLQPHGRLLYTWLDAADDAGLLKGAPAEQWRELKTRIICGADFESEARALQLLLDELGGTGVLAGSWIEDRWHNLAARAKSN